MSNRRVVTKVAPSALLPQLSIRRRRQHAAISKDRS
nr:MAG TPA: hypothetical protein [Caudoviricetes sp.]